LTKIQYREYIASAGWQERRKEYLAINNRCARCEMPRWLAEITYNQDLNVHHKSYANLGDEDWDDLEPLCRRCHEIEKFGRSDLREPKAAICIWCNNKHWNPYDDLCSRCRSERDMREICPLCGRSRVIPKFGNRNPDYCEFCDELAVGNPDAIWNSAICEIAGTDGYTLSDAALIAIMARYGKQKLLDRLSVFADAAVRYREQKKQEESRRNEIFSAPF
jgi:hypothetical protein